MAEQNILNGNAEVMQQIISDMKEHNDKVDRLDNLNAAIKSLNKDMETAEREIKTEIDEKVRAATASICEGYDKSIAADRAKIKTIQGEREKAKAAGINERIGRETESLHKDNENLQAQIVEAFKLEKLSMFCNNRLFFGLFQRKDVFDYLIFFALDLLVWLLIPLVMCMAIPDFPVWGLVPYAFLLVTVQSIVSGIVTTKVLVPHAATIEGARNNKAQIAANKKKIKSITKGIRSDKNEDMYGLGQYDYNINELHDHISKVEEEKAKALDEFEKNTKPDIVAEIDSRSRSRINTMQEEVKKKNEEVLKLDELVKQQRIYISSNYEAYLGKEFMNLDKLQEMLGFMKSGVAETVGQAMAAYRDRH